MDTKNYRYHIFVKSTSDTEEGSFELNFTDRCFSVNTHVQGGLFNWWQDSIPTFTQFLLQIYLRQGNSFKGAFYYQGPLAQEKFIAAFIE